MEIVQKNIIVLLYTKNNYKMKPNLKALIYTLFIINNLEAKPIFDLKLISNLNNYKLNSNISYDNYDFVNVIIDNNTIGLYKVFHDAQSEDENKIVDLIFAYNEINASSLKLSFKNDTLNSFEFNINNKNYVFNKSKNLLMLIDILDKVDFKCATKKSHLIDTITNSNDHIPNHNEPNNLSANSWTENHADCVIRVLVAYTDGAINTALLEDGRGIAAHIEQQIITTNQSYMNSNVNVRLKLAVSMKVNYDETNKSSSEIVNAFQDDDDGKMDEIHLQRSLYDADICVLLTGRIEDAGGRAYAIGADEADEAFCFVVAADIETNFIFAHEIGHLLGAEHNIEDATWFPFNFRNYGYGYRFTGNNGVKYRTIMAYDTDNIPPAEYTKINHWSNPNVLFQGVATGTNPPSCFLCRSSANNARVLNEQFHVVAGLFPFQSNKVVFGKTVVSNNLENITAHTIFSGSNYIIEPNAEVVFHGRDNIRISSGFHAKSGSNFHAKNSNFVDCSTSSSTGRLEATESAEHIDKVNATGSRIIIFPNPTTSKVHLTIGFDGESEIVLTDIAGKTLQTFTTTSNETDIDLSAYSNGMYFFKISNRLGKHIAKVMLSKG
ncbi:MAG: T9SS C-terminal target domain-containing protein [Bacteroidetes bacterium]|nr:MAG: T9SS C-terminal target domain-containing protein [Bacteroidota bacterium]